MPFTRENFADVTDTIAAAMEHAGKMKTVVILYETYESSKEFRGGVFTQEDATLSQINWLIDGAKHWVWSKGEGDEP